VRLDRWAVKDDDTRLARRLPQGYRAAANDPYIEVELRFQNQWEDPESGLYYNYRRYYDPDTGQYLSPDPIGLQGGLRPHGYVHNPVGWVDPWGLAACPQEVNVPDRGFTRFVGNYDEHIVFRDFDVPRKRGIGGAHNKDEFLKYSGEFKVEGVIPHPTVDGVQTIRYRMAALDRAGNPTGDYRAPIFEKTVYDPSKIPDQQFMEWGRQAAAEAQAAARLNREWVGTAPNGLEFRGYLDETGAVKSFFPNF
jgi:RHS repeat-associated protein